MKSFDYDLVRQILIEEDLEGLIKMGAPEDEYDYETKLIINRLNNEEVKDTHTVLIKLYGVFSEQFGYFKPAATPYKTFAYKAEPSRFVKAAERIWNIQK